MKQLFLLAVLLAAPVAAQAQFQAVAPPRVAQPEAPAPAADGTNLTPGFYPAPACQKPAAMPKPPEAGSGDAMTAYNARVRLFNQKAVAFNACIKAYVANAQADIQRIQAIVRGAVADANTH